MQTKRPHPGELGLMTNLKYYLPCSQGGAGGGIYPSHSSTLRLQGAFYNAPLKYTSECLIRRKVDSSTGRLALTFC